MNTRASSTARISAPALAVDDDLATSWTSGRAPGLGERLGVTLYAPADLVAIRLTSAAGLGRPRVAAVTVHAIGHVPVTLRMSDGLEEQTLPLSLQGVRDVRIRIDDVYPGTVAGLSAGFAEVQLVARGPRRLGALVQP